MRLSEWFAQRNNDGSRRRKGDFARQIGVSAGVVSDYCNGTTWPSRDVMERIVEATNGTVTANDFLQIETTSGDGA